MQVKVFITNLAAYNNGYLIGKWVTLPLDKEQLKKEIEEVLNMCIVGFEDGELSYFRYPYKFGKSEEYFVTDYEAPFKINEYENLYKLNEKLQRLNEVLKQQNLDNRVIEIMFKNGCSIDEVIDIIENENYRVYYDVASMADVAYDYLEELGILDEVPKELQNYIDFQKYGNDMELNGRFYLDFLNRMCVEIIE